MKSSSFSTLRCFRAIQLPVALFLLFFLCVPSAILADGGSNQNRTATAGESGSNRISGITVIDGGSGYTSPPAVSIVAIQAAGGLPPAPTEPD